jgi:predicted component of type VI protein secretion system
MIGEFPLKYLGIPIYYRKLSNTNWKRVEELFEKKTQQLERKTLFCHTSRSLEKT